MDFSIDETVPEQCSSASCPDTRTCRPDSPRRDFRAVQDEVVDSRPTCSPLAGTELMIGENVVGMDEGAVIKNGRVVDTVDLKRRVRLYQDHQRDGYGAIIVQANVEDSRLGVLEYACACFGPRGRGNKPATPSHIDARCIS